MKINWASVWCIAGAILLTAAVPGLVSEGWWFFTIATIAAAGALLIWAVRVPAGLLLIIGVAFAAQVVLAVLTTHDNRSHANAVPRADP